MSTPPAPSPHTDPRRVLEALPDPFFTLDAGWRLTFVNGPGAALVGREPGGLIGAGFWETFPGTLGTPLEAELRRARREGRVAEHEAYLAPLRRWLEVRAFPEGDGLGLHCRDVTGRRLAARRADALAQVARELVGALTPGDVADVLTGEVRGSLGAYSAVLYLLGGDHLREVARTGLRAPEAWRRFSLDEPHLPALVARDGEARFLHEADFLRHYPGAPRAGRTRAAAVLPLRAHGQLLGVLAYSYEHEPEFDDAERAFLLTLGGQGALALSRARHAEAAQVGERRYRSLVEATNQIVWVTNARGDFDAEQPQWAAFTGQTFGEYRGAGWLDALHPEDREETRRVWTRAVQTRTPCRAEYRARRRDGTYVWFDVRAVPVREDDGTVREWIGVEADATERRAREERYRVLSNVTNDAIWEWVFDGDHLSWNEGVHTLFGYGPGEVAPSGQWWEDHIHPEDRQRVVDGIRAVIAGAGSEWRDEYRFARRDGSYATVLDRGQVLRDAGGTAIRMIGGMTDLSERERHRSEVEAINASLERRVEERTGELRERAAELQAETDALSAFAAFMQAVGNESDLRGLARLAVQTLTRAFGDGSAVYYDRDGPLWRASAWAGDLTPQTIRLAREGFPVEALTPGLARSPGPRFVDHWARAGGEVGERTPEYGAAAFSPVGQEGAPHGLLTAGLKRVRRWTPRDQAVFRAVGHGLTLAAERAAHLRRLEEERSATAAFAAFTEGVGGETDLRALAARAVDVLHGALEGVSVGYYELDGSPEEGRWQGRALSPDVPREGFPAEAPSFARAARGGGVLFVDGWDAAREGAAGTGGSGATAFFPYEVGGAPFGLLTMASRRERVFSPGARAVFSSVARGLALAFERAENARALGEHNAELGARTRALEGFAELARDLAFETDALALVRRAQEIVLGLLPGGAAFYYEPDGELWRVRVQTGDVRNAGLQASLDAGLPFEETGNLIQPWRTGEAYYQEAYAPDTDGLPEQTRHIGATATLPIAVNGRPRGVLAVALFGTRRWGATDRVVLGTAARHLSLALERAAVAGELARQRAELRAANEELEAFSYSVSHDLRAPLRHIAGFTGSLRRAVAAGDPARAARALDVIDASVARSTALIEALLRFSHLSRREVARERVDLRALVDGLRAEAEGEAPGREVEWVVGPLPTVRGDPELLRQVLANLLANAVKYSARAPAIRVEVGHTPAPGEVVVFVRDSGAGFDPRHAERLFGVFQRLHHQHEFEGTGIGLATVRRVVQRHGGRVWAHGEPGAGATFFFSLPDA